MPEEEVKKVQTAFPGLQELSGVKPQDMEIITPGTSAQNAGENTEGSEQPPTGANANQVALEEKAPAAKPKINIDELSDEEKDELTLKLTGKTRADLNPPKAKTKEEIEADAAKKKNEALAWALTNNKTTKEKYEKVVSEKAQSDRDIALKLFTAEMQQENKDITAEEAEEMFKDLHHEDKDTDSTLYKTGQKNIQKTAENYRKENFSDIDGIEADYDNFLQTQDQYKAYKTQVKKVASALPTEIPVSIPFKDINGEDTTLEYKIPVDPKVINKIIDEIASGKEFSVRNIETDGKIEDKHLSRDMNDRLKSQMFDLIMPELLKLNSKEVEDRTIAILGNKRNQQQSLNNTSQVTKPGPQKFNTYPGLHETMARN